MYSAGEQFFLTACVFHINGMIFKMRIKLLQVFSNSCNRHINWKYILHACEYISETISGWIT